MSLPFSGLCSPWYPHLACEVEANRTSYRCHSRPPAAPAGAQAPGRGLTVLTLNPLHETDTPQHVFRNMKGVSIVSISTVHACRNLE
ncbi:hypothetical protein LTR10_021255 [Elasticomyces elasticus]|uniref:Uncharacterized protein n=1 Tax=Exophiala sideris TaxID=1016849 RepID=A0ABR0JFG0_9EURO|nr:hypothetical protein LTR10_021255 [Elasticomyces elasticus]KAK5025368.1 hypothetical protein LTS07_008219 [Exophiala sideris]KAK5032943.1 hypothetical protein LTR13_006908 [Exophiala sideris]KAK5063428.1 hypothetical protein LTR69_004134 [Exophiala sideris]KAK5180739.1 hypothetical protein LTR44_007053 [Eurotiomycetes sp. CCFEE 6388]